MNFSKNHKHELWLVVMLSLGASAIYSLLSLLRKVTSEEGLAGSTTVINRPLAELPWLDLISQVASLTLSLVPVLLALYFLRQDGISLGIVPRWRDVLHALGLAAAIGIPGIGLYLAALELGLTSRIVTSTLEDQFWAIPVLLLAALRAGLLEEIIAVGFFMKKVKLISPAITITVLIVLSAAFRASYHLYQGYSAFVGNFVMGLAFAYYFHKTGRVAPLIIAHTVMNSVAFIGAPLLGSA
jgi:membrane protease YdiL (CAAX protease family)